MTTLVVSEVFGPTVQGEGPHAGRRSWFLRLGGCNLSCSWCDTPYTWDGQHFDLRRELRRVDVADLVADLDGARRLVVTGGEPLLQSDALEPLVSTLAPRGTGIEVETNGTIAPPLWAAFASWNVSPKLANAGRPSRLCRGWLAHPRAVFKVVVTGLEDLDEVDRLDLPRDRVWVMPEGTTAERTLDVARAVADEVIARGWNLTMRTHVLLWGGERGR